MGDSDEYVKYVTERFVKYVETPRAERKESRRSNRLQREPWMIRWFGLGAMGIVLWWRRRVGRRKA